MGVFDGLRRATLKPYEFSVVADEALCSDWQQLVVARGAYLAAIVANDMLVTDDHVHQWSVDVDHLLRDVIVLRRRTLDHLRACNPIGEPAYVGPHLEASQPPAPEAAPVPALAPVVVDEEF